MPEPIPQEEYCKLSRHVSKPGRAELTSGRRIGYCTNQGLGDHQAEPAESKGVSGILKQGRQGHATLCLLLDTSGTDCHDYKSELSDRVLESARMNSGGIQGTCHFMCPYSTTPRDILGWDTHKTSNQKKHKGASAVTPSRRPQPSQWKDLNADTVATGQQRPHSVPPHTRQKQPIKVVKRRCKVATQTYIPASIDEKPGGNTLRNVGKRTAEHSSSEDDEEPPAGAHAGDLHRDEAPELPKLTGRRQAEPHPKPWERPTRPTEQY